jgi:hypothetical protein
LLDLNEYYDIEYEVKRSYYFDEGFSAKICDAIKELFNPRLQYKKEGNPLQETIKLLMNSIFGKSLLKPLEHKINIVCANKARKYITRNFNYITEFASNGINFFITQLKPINEHFNFSLFGVNVLTWSKYIMNSVMCLAEQNDVKIYYQGTDSMHILEEELTGSDNFILKNIIENSSDTLYVNFIVISHQSKLNPNKLIQSNLLVLVKNHISIYYKMNLGTRATISR